MLTMRDAYMNFSLYFFKRKSTIIRINSLKDGDVMWILIRQLYASIFSRNKLLLKVNNRLLDLALSALGYNNFRNMKESGEEFFIDKYLSNKPINLCFDIGANVGDYSNILLEKTNSKVISFEPLPFVFKKLSDNLANFSDRSVLINKGVGAKSETLTIHYNENASAHASFSEEVSQIDYLNNDDSLEIEVTSIDDYCRDNIITDVDLIKIDTEGFEKEVFEGTIETFENIQPKFIQIEFNWHQLFRNTSLNFFAEKLPNYNVYQLTYNSMRKVDSKLPYSNIYMFSNFVFIRKDCD